VVSVKKSLPRGAFGNGDFNAAEANAPRPVYSRGGAVIEGVCLDEKLGLDKIGGRGFGGESEAGDYNRGRSDHGVVGGEIDIGPFVPSREGRYADTIFVIVPPIRLGVDYNRRGKARSGVKNLRWGNAVVFENPDLRHF